LPFLALPFEVLPALVLALDAPPALLLLALEFAPPAFPLVGVVVVVVVLVPPAVEALEEVVVVVLVLVKVVFALPLVFSVVQPLKKTATASRAKSAKILRIEFSPVPYGLDCYERCGPPLKVESLRMTPPKSEPHDDALCSNILAESENMGHVCLSKTDPCADVQSLSDVRAKTFKGRPRSPFAPEQRQRVRRERLYP
jgi:hypothetical protein